ncbi:MAG TPA: universal stress protein [Candidatus Sulfotelmatobacter sp.]|nr:universal stress protein [Candidatus Sulfotelmatobacter sp.]
MRIFLAVDGTNSSDVVIQEAARRCWPAGSQFAIVQAVDPYFFTNAPTPMEEAKEAATKALEQFAQPLVEAGWPVESQVILANPRHGLTQSAKEWRADLLMIGSHGRGTVSRLLLGSTAQTVLRHAECSVEIVRRREAGGEEGMRVLVATDGSQYGEAAVRAVATRPWAKGSTFKVLSSPEYPVLVGEYPYYAPEQVAELSKQSVENAKKAVHTGTESLKQAGLTVSGEVIEPLDTPAHSILAAAEDSKTDLIVMGSHGRRGFDRLILGSVSESVALHATCSVELVRIAMVSS